METVERQCNRHGSLLHLHGAPVSEEHQLDRGCPLSSLRPSITYQPKETTVSFKEMVSKWNEDQLAQSVVYQHLTSVNPSLALDFRNTHSNCSLKIAPEKLVELIKKKFNMKIRLKLEHLDSTQFLGCCVNKSMQSTITGSKQECRYSIFRQKNCSG